MKGLKIIPLFINTKIPHHGNMIYIALHDYTDSVHNENDHHQMYHTKSKQTKKKS